MRFAESFLVIQAVNWVGASVGISVVFERERASRTPQSIAVPRVPQPRMASVSGFSGALMVEIEVLGCCCKAEEQIS